MQDGSTATACANTYSVSSGHALTIISPSSTSNGGGGLGGYKFVGSIDTMKLSKDQAGSGFTSQDAGAVDLAATTAATHISVNTPLEYPSTILSWANRIHSDGKHVWFRLASSNGTNLPHADAGKSAAYQPPYDGSPGFGPGYLTTLRNLMVANPGLIRNGDILDGDAEAENSGWWAANYGCGVQQGCTACPYVAQMTNASDPCSPISEFNRFLQIMTQQEDQDLESLGLTPCPTPTSSECVVTQVHSTDPGTATHQLSNATVQAMGNVITVDAYPDQSTTDPSVAASAWVNALNNWHQAWLNRGMNVSILVGEWGYSNAVNVSDSTQTRSWTRRSRRPFTPFLLATNYWVGPGWAGDGGYTQIFYRDTSGVWQLRPAANEVSSFYQSRQQ